MHKPFEPGNTIGKTGGGRPRGSRNRLAKTFLDDLLEIWNEPIKEGSVLRRGPAALRIMSRERPADFARLYASVMPKEFWLDSTVAELDDAELDALIEQMRQRLLVARQEKSLDAAAQMKLIPHAAH